jgi:hypothetical protein
MKTLGYSILGTFTLAMILSLFSVGSEAQTPRHRKPKPLATPTPATRELSGAEIISQGGVDEETTLVPVQKTPVKQAPNDKAKIRDLNDRVKKLETDHETSYEEAQKRMLMNLDIITRAEARSESLRKQLFDMIDKENNVKARLDQIEFDIQPAIIERNLSMQGGSMKPEEVRENRRKSLESERQNLQSLLTSIQATRATLETNLQRAEVILDKLRNKLEKDIDDSLVDKPDEQQ